MSLIKFWNKLKYWQRGATIGFILSFVFVFLFSLYVDSATFKTAEYIPFWASFIIMFAVYVIPATILGSIIGLIIGKFILKPRIPRRLRRG